MSFNIRQIRYFVAAAKRANVTAAAVGSPRRRRRSGLEETSRGGHAPPQRHQGDVTAMSFCSIAECPLRLSAATIAVGANRKRGRRTHHRRHHHVAGYFLAAPLAQPAAPSRREGAVRAPTCDPSSWSPGNSGLRHPAGVSNLKHVEGLATETLAKRRRLWTPPPTIRC
jgi:hypothetical protein